jgi:hypothetical protein
MQINISYLTAVFLAGSLVSAGPAVAWDDDVFTGQASSEVQGSDETIQESSALGRLALGLSSGPEAVRALRGSQSENNHNKDRLELPIVEMECSIDRIANYVSCYSSPVHSEEEAETLFTRLIDDLQAGLPSDRWIGAGKEPGLGTASIRSYTYEDQNSYAHIDIGIIAGTGPSGQNFYMVAIFGWPD